MFKEYVPVATRTVKVAYKTVLEVLEVIPEAILDHPVFLVLLSLLVAFL